jgi:hypothetical protein
MCFRHEARRASPGERPMASTTDPARDVRLPTVCRLARPKCARDRDDPYASGVKSSGTFVKFRDFRPPNDPIFSCCGLALVATDSGSLLANHR